ncbi:hypothetical protein FRB99_008945 [Tulasnella sp. 403]|nr:hypothetical protein FRB99_008945 [Tulasnella sp. 403]
MSTEPWTVEHHIGPPSEKIIVDGLIKKSGTVTRARSSVESSFSALGVEEQDVLLAECSLSGLKSELNDSLGDPAFRLLYEGYHHSSILDTIDSSSSLDKDCKDWRKKALKERKRLFDQPGRRDDPRLQKLENISLKCWGLQGIRRDAALFVQRPSPHSNNTLLSIKPSPLPAVESGQQDDAIIFVSVYRSNLNRGTPLNIGSKHVFLASNTLEDLHRVIMCPTKDLPYEVMDTNGDVVAYDVDSKVESGLCVAGFDSPIDGVSGAPPFGGGCVVGDGQTPSDYAEYVSLNIIRERT